MLRSDFTRSNSYFACSKTSSSCNELHAFLNDVETALNSNRLDDFVIQNPHHKRFPTLYYICIFFAYFFLLALSILTVTMRIIYVLNIGCIMNRVGIYGGLLGILICMIPTIEPTIVTLGFLSSGFDKVKLAMQNLFRTDTQNDHHKENLFLRYYRYNQNSLFSMQRLFYCLLFRDMFFPSFYPNI